MKRMFVPLAIGFTAGSVLFSDSALAVPQEDPAATISQGQVPSGDSSPAVESKEAVKRSQNEKNGEGHLPTTPTAHAGGQESDLAADEAAIRKNAAAFVKAWQAGDAKALAALFATDAECVHESVVICSGRDAIEESLTEFFQQNPGCHLIKEIDSIRIVSPGVAIEDGRTMSVCADESSCMECHYTTVYVKTNGEWLVASVHDRDAHDMKEHSLQLEQLAWLQGDWVDESDDAVVEFSCEPTDDGNFLLRSFSIHVAGQETMTGTQRIGWDPLTRRLRAWVFDSSGSFGEGLWYHRSDVNFVADDDVEIHDPPVKSGDTKECWILKLSGVMADGQAASSTSIYTLVNDYTMTWQSVNHEVGGVHQPDSDVITIVRKAVEPETAASDSSDNR
ncbi:MAG: SgcJ/EcaC family oxidoreductase [Planctomycetaceae bacterium]